MSLRLLALIPLLAGALPSARAEDPGLTDRLNQMFVGAWNHKDVKALYDQLDPECVFKSPFQTRLGRDAIRDNVFKNVQRFSQSVVVEQTSKIDGDMAYSFCSMYYDAVRNGKSVKIRTHNLNIYTRRPGHDWKARFLITLDEAEDK
jgi:ketosteroid isomerase-like protein